MIGGGGQTYLNTYGAYMIGGGGQTYAQPDRELGVHHWYLLLILFQVISTF